MKVGDLVRWIDNGWLGIVLSMSVGECYDSVKCLMVNDSSTCHFVREELEVV